MDTGMNIKSIDGLNDVIHDFGCSVASDKTVSFHVPRHCGSLSLVLFKNGKRLKKIDFPVSKRMGDVWRLRLEGVPLDGSISYVYEADGVEFPDSFGTAFEGREQFKNKRQAEKAPRAVIRDSMATGLQPLEHLIPYEESIIYRLHVRGFTEDRSSELPAQQRGTFFGLCSKLLYLKELGVTAIELMPAYEFCELQGRGASKSGAMSPDDRVNYWGFTPEALRFAPKAAFGGEQGLRELIEAVHRQGMELILDMYFTGNESEDYVLSVLRSWRYRYGIDGVHIVGYAPIKLILNDPYLRGMKLMADSINENDLCRREDEASFPIKREEVTEPGTAAIYNDGFQDSMRRFLKGDEGMIPEAMGLIRENGDRIARINYIANVSGFSLMDVYSYDQKHNEANGEKGADGTDFNFSWNCGEEGPSRKKRVNELRRRLYKNAMTLTLLSRGTPLINSGDEMGHTKKGNNNSWCMDGPIEWINWKDIEKNRDIFDFVSRLIRLRKEHPIFRTAVRGTDYLYTGLPDLSFHGKSAWKVDMENYRRQLGICFNGDYAKLPSGKADDSFYLAVNMHWESHRFYLPKLMKDRRWYLLMDTSRPDSFVDEEAPEELELQDSISLPARSIILLTGR